MSKEAFFSRKAQTTEITLDDDTTWKARKLTQAEVETLKRKYKGDEKLLEALRYIVSRTIVDDDGERLFDDNDLGKLADVDFGTINTIATAVMAFSGLNTNAKNA